MLHLSHGNITYDVGLLTLITLINIMLRSGTQDQQKSNNWKTVVARIIAEKVESDQCKVRHRYLGSQWVAKPALTTFS